MFSNVGKRVFVASSTRNIKIFFFYIFLCAGGEMKKSKPSTSRRAEIQLLYQSYTGGLPTLPAAGLLTFLHKEQMEQTSNEETAQSLIDRYEIEEAGEWRLSLPHVIQVENIWIQIAIYIRCVSFYSFLLRKSSYFFPPPNPKILKCRVNTEYLYWKQNNERHSCQEIYFFVFLFFLGNMHVNLWRQHPA